MENHPIPQDITGFQFKLIGNMTIKQFIYLAVGAVFAWILFFIFDLPTLVKWPLSIISISLGAIIAFVPVDGRPMDVMLINFFRAIASPTEYIYQKEGGKLPKVPTIPSPNTPKLTAPTPIAISKANISIQPLDAPAQSKTEDSYHDLSKKPEKEHHSLIHDLRESLEHKKTAKNTSEIKEIKKENTKLQEEIDEIKKSLEDSQKTQKQTQNAPVDLPPPPPPQPTPSFSGFGGGPLPVPISEENKDEEEIIKRNKEIEEMRAEKDKLKDEVELLKKQLEEAMKEKEKAQTATPAELTPPPPPPQPAQPQQDLEKQLIESNRQREALEKELISIKSKPEAPQKTFNPIVATPVQTTQRVRSVPQGMEKSVGIPSIPDAPNLITGIVKDPRGNPLQNILIEVKDQDSNPVRAFKTNGLGKFASATSLSNGKYVISFEDPKETHKFDAVEMELVGTPVMPLEIISVDPREELRRELFN